MKIKSLMYVLMGTMLVTTSCSDNELEKGNDGSGGMIYLAKEWQLGGYARLKELFDQGYHGFARKCI